jgi:hypothetical protein
MPFDLHFPTAGHSSAPIIVSDVHVVMRIDPAMRSAAGVIAGVILGNDAIAWTRAYGRDSPRSTFCGPDGTDSVGAQQFFAEIAQGQDMLADGTNKPGVPCDAISFGIGFDAVAVKLGGYGSSPPLPPDPCDAGTD